MTDVVDRETRSRMMSGIKGKNTKPEQIIRKGLHSKSYRFRLHDSRLPGNPDLVFAKFKAVVFVNGCFWHGHDCHLFRWPATRPEFWREKIERNRERDKEAISDLENLGWKVLVVWECALKGKSRKDPEMVLEEISCWLEQGSKSSNIKGAES